MSTQAFDFSVDVMACLLWQYNDATRLQSLLQDKQDWLNSAQEGFWDNWLSDVFDLTTANEFGLSVWATILGLPLSLSAQVQADKPLWGFGPDNVGFSQGNFASGGSVSLSAEQRRLVLRLRYFQLTSRGAVLETNAFLETVFGAGQVYVADSEEMQIAYVFTQPPSSAVELVLTEFDLLPRPAGVLAHYIVRDEADGFGFGRYHENFTNGPFVGA